MSTHRAGSSLRPIEINDPGARIADRLDVGESVVIAAGTPHKLINQARSPPRARRKPRSSGVTPNLGFPERVRECAASSHNHPYRALPARVGAFDDLVPPPAVFTPEERERLREALVSVARTDERFTGAALTGSFAGP